MAELAFNQLLTTSDGPAVRVLNEAGSGNIVFVCEHASNKVPSGLGNTLAPAAVLASHAGWDPGALAVSQHLSEALDAPLVAAQFSRLVYDVNRPPTSPEAIRATSEIHDIPGNVGLSEWERQQRCELFYETFHAALSRLLDDRAADGKAMIIVTVHSFTAHYYGRFREVELGILHDSDSRLADAMLLDAPNHTQLQTRRNEPYGPLDRVTHTLRRHALKRGLHNVMLEIRNDLIETEAQQRDIASTIELLLRSALSRLGSSIAPALTQTTRVAT